MIDLTNPTSKSNSKPNVIFVTVNCLRPDFLGSYNPSEKQVAPTIDSLTSPVTYLKMPLLTLHKRQ
jgi:hypothetical protein